ncbi:vinorine synthase-like [Lycium barbarum]|uniref:vinorine synthase-like n=1 Tax=Lycium barbarum TaxID=112863 RepID=UPI00293E67BD|nr:vinorine synthase-like [Lycium barbarum]
MSSRKFEKVCRELIRPISPTSNHLRCFQFSLLDQMTRPTSVHFALFYPPPPTTTPCGGDQSYSYEQARAVNSSRLLVLKKSLCETLASFYPFAGRIKDNSIECNDDGVPFYEAFAHKYRLKDLLRQPHVDIQILPTVDDQEGSIVHIPLLVQVTLFECGGITIGIRASHKIADLSTLCTLINAWAVTARGSPNCVDVPEFVAAAKFLPHPIPHVSPDSSNMIELFKPFLDNQRVTKIFVFDASTIVSLKSKVDWSFVPTPTRVEVVSATIWKCFMIASACTRTSSYLMYNVNIRKRLVPPLPNHCVGNVVATTTTCKGENDGSDLATLVTCIRKGLSDLILKYVDKSRQYEAILAIPRDSIKLGIEFLEKKIQLFINSWCVYQFYEVDFGWGKPSWVSPVEQPIKNLILLLDSRDGGIDAYVCLSEKEMAAFEHELVDLLAIGSAK